VPAARGNGQANPQKALSAKALTLPVLARLEEGEPERASLPRIRGNQRYIPPVRLKAGDKRSQLMTSQRCQIS
jgi:hypothetical protein